MRKHGFPVVADYIERIGRALTTLTSERVKTPREELTPGTTAAVIEAYRLLTGTEPVYRAHCRDWVHSDRQACPPQGSRGACLINWLDENAPGGKP